MLYGQVKPFPKLSFIHHLESNIELQWKVEEYAQFVINSYYHVFFNHDLYIHTIVISVILFHNNLIDPYIMCPDNLND